VNIGELISQVLGRASDHIPFEDPEMQNAVRVLSRVQMHLYGSWKHAQQMGIPCQQRMRSRERGELRCVEPMAGTCVACRKPVCLHHSAAVVDSGDLICFGCIGNAQQVAQTQEGKASAASSDSYQRQGQSPPRPAAEDEEKLRKKHLKRLKLTGEPTEEEIRAAFKREAAKAHPDALGPASAEKKQKAHERFVALGEARDWRLSHVKKKAA